MYQIIEFGGDYVLQKIPEHALDMYPQRPYIRMAAYSSWHIPLRSCRSSTLGLPNHANSPGCS